MKHTCPECKCEFEVKRPRKPKEVKETNPDVPKVIKYYADRFHVTFGSYPEIKWALCGTIAKALLRDYGYDQTCAYIDEYLKTQDKFMREAGLRFSLIPAFIQKRAVIQKSAWNGMM